MASKVGCGPCGFTRREMPALSLFGGPTLQIMAPAFPKIDSLYSVNRCRTGSPFPVTKPFLKRAGLIPLTKIDADLAAV